MILYRSRQESGKRNNRVWRSLVSRLNGVQEASSSNLDTRTTKTERAFALSVFVFLMRDSNNLMQLSGGQLLADGLTAATHWFWFPLGIRMQRISTLGPKRSVFQELAVFLMPIVKWFFRFSRALIPGWYAVDTEIMLFWIRRLSGRRWNGHRRNGRSLRLNAL